MKRRDFLRSAGAATVIPVLPLPAQAIPVATAPAASVNAMQVGWAALYARVNNEVSPALLQKWLRLTPPQADAMMRELLSRNLIHTSATGSVVAVNPMYPRGKVPGAFGKATDAAKALREQVESLIGDNASDDDAIAQPITDADAASIAQEHAPKQDEPDETS
ncbi:MAG: hypothetical protein AAGL89_15620 [Pseudomonadota bacterium]